MNVKREQRPHSLVVFPAHGVFRAEAARMKVSLAIWAAASAAGNKWVVSHSN